MNKELLYPSKQTICRLTRELELKGATEYTQDWECEVANMDQLPKYIKYYMSTQLNSNEKSTLMRIILEAYNDYVGMHCKEDEYGKIIEDLLGSDYFIHQEAIKYWGCKNDDLGDCFAITPFIRAIRDNIGIICENE